MHISVYTSLIPTSTAIAIAISGADTEYSSSRYVGASSVPPRHTTPWSAAASSRNQKMAHFTSKVPDGSSRWWTV